MGLAVHKRGVVLRPRAFARVAAGRGGGDEFQQSSRFLLEAATCARLAQCWWPSLVPPLCQRAPGTGWATVSLGILLSTDSFNCEICLNVVETRPILACWPHYSFPGALRSLFLCCSLSALPAPGTPSRADGMMWLTGSLPKGRARGGFHLPGLRGSSRWLVFLPVGILHLILRLPPCSRTFASSSRISRCLGWMGQIDAEDAVSATIRAGRAAGASDSCASQMGFSVRAQAGR